MKEASGEANMTVITIVIIGVVAALATPIIQGVMKNVNKSSCCQSNGGVWANGKCTTADGTSEVSAECPK